MKSKAGDHLYLSLANSNRDISWADAPNWVSYPFDVPNTEFKGEIVNNDMKGKTSGDLKTRWNEEHPDDLIP